MGKTNWKRVLLGGLVAGVVFNIILFAASAIYLDDLFTPALQALNPNYQSATGSLIFWLVLNFVSGILLVWLYSSIRPRYGAGPKTALILGLVLWVMGPLTLDAILGEMQLFPGTTLVIDALTGLVMFVVATLAGAWVYKEQP
jgi:spore maturation protein SpmA